MTFNHFKTRKELILITVQVLIGIVKDMKLCMRICELHMQKSRGRENMSSCELKKSPINKVFADKIIFYMSIRMHFNIIV